MGIINKNKRFRLWAALPDLEEVEETSTIVDIHSAKVLIGHLKKSNILAKISKIQKIPPFQEKGI